MHNPALDFFLAVSDCGSFTKASEKLFVSPTAVMKKINAFEAHLGLTLFKRSAHGVSLTGAGEMIYENAKRIVEFSQKAVKEAQAAAQEYDTTFCVGTSMLNPAKPFMDLWYKISDDFPGYKLHLVPFEDDCKGIVQEIENLGVKFDFLIGVCDSKVWLSLCSFLPVGRYKKMVAVSREHPLAKKDRLCVADLYGETLMMVKEGDSGVNDFLRHDLQKNHPQIRIEDTPQFYDLSVFNACAQSNKVLLTVECWQDVHPGLVTLPVEWNYSIPYGLLYSKNAPKDVLEFVDKVDKLTAREQKV